jgi:hypothetical protein
MRFSHPRLSSSLLGSKILLGTFFPNTLNLYSSLKGARYQFFSHMYKKFVTFSTAHLNLKLKQCTVRTISHSIYLSFYPPTHLSTYLPTYLPAYLIIIFSCCSHLEHCVSVKRFVSLQFLNLR